MATVTPPPPVTPDKRADWQRKVSDPLERLRGYIRLYVSIEGAAVLLLYLALWFWIGLLLDYGFFKILGVDWVQILHKSFRVGLLIVLVSGLLAFLVAKVTLRLAREFRDSSLALVLERRFPKLLGDRLITAVELADPQKSARYGFSQAMIDQTIQDAAERVGQVPVNEAFNWKRLRGFVALVAGITLGLFLLCWGGYYAVQALSPEDNQDAQKAAQQQATLARRLESLEAPKDNPDAKSQAQQAAMDAQKALEQAKSPGDAKEQLAKAADAAEKLARDLAKEQGDAAKANAASAAELAREQRNLADQAGKPNGAARPKASFFTDFGNVSAIWFERNILLQNTIWPRRVHLELVGFPESGEVRIGKNIGRVDFRVRALKWVYADKESPEGWRQLMWSDLNDKLLGSTAPPLPAEFFKGGQDWSVDAVDVLIERGDVRQKMNQTMPGFHGQLRDVIDKLALLTSESAMSRTLRQLEVPNEIVVNCWGDNTQTEQTFKKEENSNEYEVKLQDLKETVRFQAHAVDYWTKTRTIAIVPPPALQDLQREEAQPAYLYHRLPVGGSRADLQGLKQRFPRERVYLGGEASRIDLPAGSDLKLIGSTGRGEKDKDLASVVIVPRGLAEFQKTLPENLRELPAAEAWLKAKNVGPVKLIDERTFEVQINNITSRLDFDFEMIDTDNVVARRHVIIQPGEDVAPEVEVGPVTVRKTPEGYMVTAVAKIPFEGRVRKGAGSAEGGINSIQYDYGYTTMEEKSVNLERLKIALEIFHVSPDSVAGSPLLAPAYAALVVKAVDRPENEQKGLVPLDTFEAVLKEKARGDVGRDDLLKRLKSKPEGKPLVKLHEINPAIEGFDLQRHLPQLKVTGGSQPRYRLRLKLAATDNNVEFEAEPNRPSNLPKYGKLAESKETFGFIIVSEDELLGAIAKEEADLHDKLKGQAVAKLEVFRTRLTLVSSYLSAKDFKPSDYSPQAELTLQIAEGISTAALTAREVRDDFVRILNELDVNRVDKEKMPNKVKNIVDLLKKAMDDEFPAAEEAQRELQQALAKAEKDPEAAKRIPDLVKNAQVRLDDLIAQLNRVIDAMGQLKQLNDRIKELREIVAAQKENVARLRYIQKILEDLLFGD